MHKELLSGIAVALTFALFWPYIRSIRRGETKPHVFSWAIWGAGTLIVFFAQRAGGGGLGAWVIGVSGCITSYIAVLAYFRRSDLSITRTDWGFLIAALSALPFWFLTSEPLWAVVILTVSDLIGFGPTFRTAYHRPYDERMWFYGFSAFRNLLVVLALHVHSLTTVLFPAVVGFACFILMVVISFRRRAMASHSIGRKLDTA
jgi:hypothetical protein